MNRILPSLVTLGVIVWISACGFARASDPAQGLPAGHPPIGTQPPSTQPASGMPELPAGHPAIPSLPADGGQLPSGHPDISNMNPRPGVNPPSIASVTVKAEQGTVGGPAIGGDPVTVEVVAGDQVVGKIDTRLNAQGMIIISGLPVGHMYQPVVTVRHAGVSYRTIGAPIEAATQTVNVKVYETTDKPIDWDVRVRHLMLQPTATGVDVVDVIAIDNATDRAYLGAAVDQTRTSFEIPLPANATDVKFTGGFDDAGAKVLNGKVVSSSPIVPGTTEYQLTYTVVPKDGVTEITACAPAITRHMIVFAPNDGTTIVAAGLESGTSRMGDREIRYFKANSVPAGKVITLNVSGQPTAPAKGGFSDAQGSGRSDIAGITKLVGGIGGGLIMLVGGAFVLRRAVSQSARLATGIGEM